MGFRTPYSRLAGKIRFLASLRPTTASWKYDGGILGTVVFLVLLAPSAAAIFLIEHPDFTIKYIWLLGGAILLAFIFSLDGEVSRIDGTITRAAYVAFMVYLVRDLWRTSAAREEIEEGEAEVGKIIKEPERRFPLMFPGGLVGLVIGALPVTRRTKVVL